MLIFKSRCKKPAIDFEGLLPCGACFTSWVLDLFSRQVNHLLLLMVTRKREQEYLMIKGVMHEKDQRRKNLKGDLMKP